MTHLLQLLLFGEEVLVVVVSSSMLFALKKLSWKNLKNCGRFLIKLLLTSFSLSFIWLSNSKFVVAFDFDLYAVNGWFVRRHPVCEPNNPIMSNSYTKIYLQLKIELRELLSWHIHYKATAVVCCTMPICKQRVEALFFNDNGEMQNESKDTLH